MFNLFDKKFSGKEICLSGDDATKAITYACLVLADDDLTVTADKLNEILKAANIRVDSFMTSIFVTVSK